MRKRSGSAAPSTESNLDSILQHHQQQQERLAEDMVNLARNMKDQAKVANQIVQDDNKVSDLYINRWMRIIGYCLYYYSFEVAIRKILELLDVDLCWFMNALFVFYAPPDSLGRDNWGT